MFLKATIFNLKLFYIPERGWGILAGGLGRSMDILRQINYRQIHRQIGKYKNRQQNCTYNESWLGTRAFNGYTEVDQLQLDIKIDSKIVNIMNLRLGLGLDVMRYRTTELGLLMDILRQINQIDRQIVTLIDIQMDGLYVNSKQIYLTNLSDISKETYSYYI